MFVYECNISRTQAVTLQAVSLVVKVKHSALLCDSGVGSTEGAGLTACAQKGRGLHHARRRGRGLQHARSFHRVVQ